MLDVKAILGYGVLCNGKLQGSSAVAVAFIRVDALLFDCTVHTS